MAENPGAAPALRPAASISPVLPSDGSRQLLHPLSNTDISLSSSFWRPRLEANREASLTHAAEELERAGNFHNFRVASGRESDGYRGFSAIGVPYLFLDSDVYKWLEAVCWELGRRRSPHLQALADDATALLAAAQEADGYLNTYFQITTPGRRFHQLVTGHELYCAGHLIQAGVAAKRAIGSMALLRIAERNADCIFAAFVEQGNPGLPAHPGIEMALVELYRTTGQRRHLELARLFIDRRGRGLLGFGRYGPSYYEDHVPIREARTITGHAVMALYLDSGLVDAYAETGEEALLETATRQWDDLVSSKTYITGGIGSRHRDEAIGDAYELPPDRAYCETCAAIASVMLSWRLLLVTGHGKYADLIERTLYNGVLPGVSLDGRRFFYANPLQVRSVHADPADGVGAAVRAPWFYCACCPPNVMRTLSSLEHCIATANEHGVQLHQYVEGELTARVGGADTARLRVTTAYPWRRTVAIEIVDGPPRPWELSLRVPGWAAGAATIMLDGATGAATRDAKSYHGISRNWRAGDTVTLELPIEARWTAPDERIDALRGCVALERGPLVYCFEACDQATGTDLDDVAVDPDPAGLEEVEMPGSLGGIVALRCRGVRRDAPAVPWPYRPAAASGETQAEQSLSLLAIPYFAWANRERGAMRVWVPQRR
ncbi:MAG: glycoside hydrolase family 127 protein [Hyphomicrobiales bacterium]